MSRETQHAPAPPNPGPATYRLLVVDDEPQVPKEVKRQFEEDPSVDVSVAKSTVETARHLRENYVDAAIVDMLLESPSDGLEVIRDMGRLTPTAEVIVVTQLDDVLPNVVATQTPPVVGLYEKRDLEEDWAVHAFEGMIEVWRKRAVSVRNTGFVIDFLDEDEQRKRIPGLRSKREIGIELDRLCRAIFGEVKGIGQPVQIALRPIEREGFSPSITVIADVHIGQDFNDEDLPDAVTVLKIGPIAHIAAEVERYEAVVKYGVRLTHRVELLGHAREQTLGAISYSFAGGVFGVELTSLDELLRSPAREQIADGALQRLFESSSRNWYRVKLRPVAPISYFRGDPKLDISDAYERTEGSLRRLRNRFQGEISFDAPNKRAGKLKVDNAVLRIPPENMWGGGAFVAAKPTCLIHGDLHAGNVMVELNEIAKSPTEGELGLRRVCLIDFQSAGRGPRLLDFIALEASVRFADVHEMAKALGVERESDLAETDLLTALRLAAHRRADETLLLNALFDATPFTISARWQKWVLRLQEMASWNFDDLDTSEYVTVAALYVLRQMSYKLGPVSRVRLLAWMAALTERIADLGQTEDPE